MEEKRIWHKGLAAGRWFTFSFDEQMGNIGSEVGRTIKWFRAKDKERFESCFERALELFDLTLTDKRWETEKLEEISESKLKFISLVTDTSPEDAEVVTELDELDEYFLQFGIAARLKRFG
jgi:hypothetical protein